MQNNKNKNYESRVKLLMLGESGKIVLFVVFNIFIGVGKTNLLLRFSEDNFSTNFITTLGFFIFTN